ncbi:hypothetical protein HY642_06415 [Candidatus Woesearchaeota archaeon]|nr:hypothetical protein [Candidatus Woesearchaeota archaeon]
MPLLFWRKKKPKDIHQELQDIESRVKALPTLQQKIDATVKAVNGITADIEQAEKDMLERAEELKARPWVDVKFDPAIDELAAQEVKALKKLEADLDMYESMVASTTSHEEVDSALQLISGETQDIAERDEANETAVTAYGAQTITERERLPSASVPAQKTKDGTPFARVATVVRALGGYIEFAGGKHPYHICFAGVGTVVPLSADVGIEKLAQQVRQQLTKALPKHKVPKRVNLQNAFASGDVTRTAA